MFWRPPVKLTMPMIVVLITPLVESGTKPATPKQKVNPIDELLAEIRKVDPNGRIYQEIRYAGTMNVAEAVITDIWDRSDYERRRTFVNLLCLTWDRVHPPSMGMVVVVDQRGRIVGRGSAGGDIWIQR
jgi:hypothetical protein